VRDRVVERRDSLCEKIGDGLGGVITGVSGFVRLPQEVADNDRQMVSNMLDSDITEMTCPEAEKGGEQGGAVDSQGRVLSAMGCWHYQHLPSKTPVNVHRRPCTSSCVTT